jgi:acyl-CoA thioester hydrolase
VRFERLPSLEQVRALPCYLRRVVPEAYLDQNGHMNIQHYMGLYDEAGVPFLEGLGIDAAYVAERRLGVFDLETHLSYLAECHAGDRVAVHGRLLGRSAKRIHAVWFLVNETRGELSNIYEFVTSHADLEARRTAPFPDDVAARLDALLEGQADLTWPAPVCGVMSA